MNDINSKDKKEYLVEKIHFLITVIINFEIHFQY